MQGYSDHNLSRAEVFAVRCGDCAAPIGRLHDLGCDVERCPFCTRQLISCDCIYAQLGINVTPGTPGFDEKVFSAGPTDEQLGRFREMLEEKGRIPFLYLPSNCETCGVLAPVMFMVEDWFEVVPPALHRYVLCRRCYQSIRSGNAGDLQLEPGHFCVFCGSPEPMLSKPEDFDLYVPPLHRSGARLSLQHDAVCERCFEQVQKAMPNGWRQAEQHQLVPDPAARHSSGRRRMQ